MRSSALARLAVLFLTLVPATKLPNSNVRFNFIHSPLSDLFIVWNEQRFETGEGIIPGRSLTIKFTKMMAF